MGWGDFLLRFCSTESTFPSYSNRIQPIIKKNFFLQILGGGKTQVGGGGGGGGGIPGPPPPLYETLPYDTTLPPRNLPRLIVKLSSSGGGSFTEWIRSSEEVGEELSSTDL